MKFLIFFGTLYLLLTSMVSFSQRSVRIIDQSTKSGLPFATIVNLTNPGIRFSDENGAFIFEWKDSDSIRITYIGYYDTIIQFGKLTNDIVQLLRQSTLLADVTISTCIKRVIHRYTNFNPPSDYAEFGGLSWQENVENGKVAIMIQPPAQNLQLSGLEFELKKSPGAPKRRYKAPIRFSFFFIDQKTKLPSEPFSIRTVIYNPEKVGKQMLSLDSLGLAIPDSGLYIGIEYLIDKDYYFPVRFHDPLTGADSVIMQYGLMFSGVRAKDFQLAFYDYRVGEWFFGGHKKEKEWDKPHGTIKFGIIYKSCGRKN